MKRLGLWVTVSLVNLCLLALAGALLRTKFLFPMPYLDYRDLLSAHSHFAFGGWATLALMVLLIEKLLEPEQKQKRIYQGILASIQVCSFGMLVTFPFGGYWWLSIFFSTAYIVTTYIFCLVYGRDLFRTALPASLKMLVTGALASLVISSVGPFNLAKMMATGTGTIFQQRDAVYTFLHFQYNGFFTLAILALFFHDKFREVSVQMGKRIRVFVILVLLALVPSLFLSLLWHGTNLSLIRPLAYSGAALVILSVIAFLFLVPGLWARMAGGSSVARLLLAFALVSFFIKMLLQTGTVFPELGNAVFGFRPVIIGYLHQIFLGMLTFYILSRYVEDDHIPMRLVFARFALFYFSAMIFFHQLILLVNGVELLRGRPHPVYGWLVWIAALGLFSGAVLMALSRIRSRAGSMV